MTVDYPTISAIVPTQGRPTLERALASAAPQLLSGDEVLVIVDTHGMGEADFFAVAARVSAFGPQFHAHGYDAGFHAYGHPQFDHGLTLAEGDYILGNDDDDVWTADAFAAIREAIAALESPRPLLFRFRSPWGTLYWQERGLVRQATIGGHCLIQPGQAHGRVGYRQARHYEADFTWIVNTLANWAPTEPVWVDQVIAIQRPRE